MFGVVSETWVAIHIPSFSLRSGLSNGLCFKKIYQIIREILRFKDIFSLTIWSVLDVLVRRFRQGLP